MEVQSVSKVVLSIKNLLEGEFLDLTVEGEISNLSHSSAGHYYFTLSDKNSSLSCALFKMDALRNPLIRKVKNGDKVIIKGPISVYQKRGSFQLIVKRITPYGVGDLKVQFEKLKSELARDGYFDLEHKKEIPHLAKRIAIITAIQGAALQDFLNIIKRRSLWHNIVIIPATVQGDNCPKSVIRAISKAESLKDIDVIVIARGGGSLEDLWGFNNKEVVQAAFNCKIPIISAIGHQVDYSLLDFVSDLRCETPSAAAEILTQEHTALNKRITHLVKHLKIYGKTIHGAIENKLFKLNPLNILPLIQKNLSEQKHRLESQSLSHRINLLGVHEAHQELDEAIERMTRTVEYKLSENRHKLTNIQNVLHSLNPISVLERGYSILSIKNGKVLTSYSDFDRLDKEAPLTVRFSDGQGSVYKKK